MRGFAVPPTIIGGRGCCTGFGQTSSAVRPLPHDLRELAVELVEPLARRQEREAVGLVLGLEPAGADAELGAAVPRCGRRWSTPSRAPTAWRNVTGETIVPRRIRSVRAASAASVVHASSEPAGSPRTIER